MREYVIALINDFAGKTDGVYYHMNYLQSFSNKELIELLLEEHKELVLLEDNK